MSPRTATTIAMMKRAHAPLLGDVEAVPWDGLLTFGPGYRRSQQTKVKISAKPSQACNLILALGFHRTSLTRRLTDRSWALVSR